MRILHVINSINPCGGGPIESILQGFRELAPRGVEVELVCVDSPESSWIQQDWGFRVHAVGPAYTSYRYAPRLRNWLRSNLERFDLSIMHSAWQFLGHCLHRESRRLKRPYFIYPHGSIDPAHRKVFPQKHLQKQIIWKMFEYRTFQDATGILYTGEKERELAPLAFSPRITNHNAMVVPYCTGEPPEGTERQMEAFQTAFPALANKTFILFLSRVHPKKGVDILLEAYAREYPLRTDEHLVIAGPGEEAYLTKLRDLASKLGISERVHWVGMLAGDLKWGAFRSASCFALASHQENFGIAVVEALACGLPVLITEGINIFPEIQQAGGGLVGRDTIGEFSPVLCRWKSMSQEQKQTMAHAARKCFESQFSASKSADQFLTAVERKLQDVQLHS